MKESRKEAKRRPVLNAKKLGKRKGRLMRKMTGDPKYKDRLFDALAEALSEDRSRYYDSFLSAWEQAAVSLDAARDAIMASPDARIGDAQIERFGMAWDPMAVRVFMRLADRLTEQEERVLRIRRDRLAVAWSSFAAALATETVHTVPEEEIPNALFRNGWLRKGNGAVLVAETGKGKSVLSLQMAFCWARGVPAFGIEPMKIKVKDGDGGAVKERTGLKIAVFQTEDDDDEMRRFRDESRCALLGLG